MNNIEKLNKRMEKEFIDNKNYVSLERYVMSELMSPIEDFINAINIIRENDEYIEGLNLYYIAAYLSAEWILEANDFLRKLNGMINLVNDNDKAIIYYLNAYSIFFSEKNVRSNENYKINLLKSIECSKNTNFVNNRYDISKTFEGKEAENYLKDALTNVKIIETKETLKTKPMDYWLSSQRFVDEFILGTHLTQEVYLYKFGRLLSEISREEQIRTNMPDLNN
ncbi:MAG: hypothetical protein IJ291_05605 [Lachnospiraceae bacterium]|nr:hypothetical protein [Lachnospiraceae bacterium]